MKLLILLLAILFIALPVFAYQPQPKPVSFWFNDEGEVFGELEDGSRFSQVNVAGNLGIRLQRFTWTGGSWYISDLGIIEADNDLQAFSIYLSMK